MAGLAHIAADLGITVTGSDVVSSKMIQSLQKRGCPVVVGHCSVTPDTDLLVYSSAVPKEDPERIAAAKMNIPELCRGKFLAVLATEFDKVIAIAGSHGKTTTTAMLAHIACEAGLKPAFMVGGNVNGWERSAMAGAGKLLITEVDESDGTQAFLSSSAAIILNIEDDHCWSHGGVPALEKCFRTFAEKATRVFAWDAGKSPRVLAGLSQLTLLNPALIEKQAWLKGAPGHHNCGNAAIACYVAEHYLGIAPELVRIAIQSYPGVDRRLSCRFASKDGSYLLYEDYAHHPTEVQASLQTLREEYPDYQLWVVFQPHRYERILRFADQFAEILSKADGVEVVAPFAAWVQDEKKADPKCIVNKICQQADIPCGYWQENLELLPEKLVRDLMVLKKPVVIAVLGAGDVNKMIPELVLQLKAAVASGKK
ncbi:MAG: cyanophycin synthetase, partial [Lentisphaeria bacterium]